MFKPKYRILLTSRCFLEDRVVGLGRQLVLIIDSIKCYLAPHVWYGADVEAVGKGSTTRHFKDIQLKKIGSDLEFISCCNEVDQFIWGVFLCVDNNFSFQSIQGIELETEDKSFRPVNVNGALMEIRAFDTTYFGLYFDDLELAKKISKIYRVEIEKNDA